MVRERIWNAQDLWPNLVYPFLQIVCWAVFKVVFVCLFCFVIENLGKLKQTIQGNRGGETISLTMQHGIKLPLLTGKSLQDVPRENALIPWPFLPLMKGGEAVVFTE